MKNAESGKAGIQDQPEGQKPEAPKIDAGMKRTDICFACSVLTEAAESLEIARTQIFKELTLRITILADKVGFYQDRCGHVWKSEDYETDKRPGQNDPAFKVRTRRCGICGFVKIDYYKSKF